MKTELKIDRINRALDGLQEYEENCGLCPRECGVNRKKGEEGFCKSGIHASLSHAVLHFGEEPVLSGYHDWRKDGKTRGDRRAGSGTIFFTGCNLKCLFCQNYQLSWLNQGREVSDEELAEKMVELQAQGALNINLISPTHLILPVLRALRIAFSRGLRLPIVSNSNGYEKAEVLRFLYGIIDIYLPDLKYFSPQTSARFSGAADYFKHAGEAVREMYRQQPVLLLTRQEVARKGLIIRHLVLPGQVEDSRALLGWIVANLSPSVCISLMSQYHACFRALPEIQRHLTPEEYGKVLARAEELGIENMFVQPEPFAEEEHLIPDFSLPDPFKWK